MNEVRRVLGVDLCTPVLWLLSPDNKVTKLVFGHGPQTEETRNLVLKFI